MIHQPCYLYAYVIDIFGDGIRLLPGAKRRREATVKGEHHRWHSKKSVQKADSGREQAFCGAKIVNVRYNIDSRWRRKST